MRVCLEERTASLVPEAAARACTVADGATAVNRADAVVVLGGEGNREFFVHLAIPGPGIGLEVALELAREVTRP